MLLPLLGVAALVLVSSARLQKLSVENDLQARARVLASVTDLKLRDLVAALTILRSAQPVDVGHPERFQSIAGRYLASHPDWQALALLDSAATVQASTGRDAIALAAACVDAVRRDAPSAGIGMVTLSGGQRPIIGVLAPVQHGHGAAGWVCVAVPAESLLPTPSDYDRAQGDMVALLDRRHTVLAAADTALAGQTWPYLPAGRAPAPGTAMTAPMTARAMFAGRPAYSVVTHLTSAPWDAALVVPASVVEAPLRVSGLLLVGLAALLAVPLALSLLLGEWLGRRIQALAVIADAVAHEAALPVLSPTRLKEVGTVQAALVHAARLVEERRTTLERLRVMEANLKRLQQLESVGQLSAAIAHDFGSHLFTIRGQLERIREAAHDDIAMQELAGPALEVAERAVRLVRELSSLSLHKSAGLTRVNINLVLREMAALLQHLAGRTVRVELHLAGNLWDCRFDPMRLQSALVNLVTNARDALPAGGSVRIATRNLTVSPQRQPNRMGLRPGRYVSLTVTDNGAGMPPETMAHIFEPFFTTKPEGSGTGIGLSVLSGSVRSAGGTVLVDSTLGTGTTFTILLPEMSAVTSGRFDGTCVTRTADIVGADIVGGNVAGANVAGANVASANVAGASIACANITGADIVGANVAGADVAGANIG